MNRDPLAVHYMKILGLSNDRKGLMVRGYNRGPATDGVVWHVHSDEMTPYQRSAHRRLLAKRSLSTRRGAR